jgi:hypothetical protein
MFDEQKAVLMECLDLLADTPFASTLTEKQELAQTIIDTMASYPKPRSKGENKEESPKELGAYLFNSNARNIVKLAILEYITPLILGLN